MEARIDAAPRPYDGQVPHRFASAADAKLWLSERFAGETDANRMLEIALEAMGRFLRVSRVAYGELDADLTCMTVPRDWTDGSVRSKTGTRVFEADSPFARHYRAGRTLVVADTATATLDADQIEGLEKGGLRSVVGVPLIEGGKLVAVFNATHTEPRAWTEDEVVLFAQTGARLWGALQHLRMLDRLREGEEQFRTLAENMPGLCWLGDADGKPYWGNRRWTEFFAGTGGDEGDADWTVHPDDRERVLGAWAVARKAGTPIEATVRMRSADGVFRPFLSSGAPIHDAAGRVIRWCGTMVDLSAQDAHERRQAFLRAFADATRDETDAFRILATLADMTVAHMDARSVAFCEATADPRRFDVFLARKGHRFTELPGMFRFREGFGPLFDTFESGETLVTASLDDPVPELTREVIAGGQSLGICAAITVPLVRDGRLVAMLSVSDPKPRRWTDEEVQLVEELADRAWGSVSRARAEAALAERERNQSFLVAWGDRVRGEHAVDAIIAVTLQALAGHLGVTRATHSESDRSGRVFAILGEWRASDVVSLANTSFSLDDVGTEVERDWVAGAVVRYDDVGTDPRIEDAVRDSYLQASIRAFVSVPLVENGRVRSALSVQHRDRRHWRDGEIQLLRDVAERVWVLLERARAQAELVERERHQAFLIAWSDAVRGETSAQAIVRITLERLGRHLGVSRATFAHCEADGRRFTVTGEWRDGVGSVLGNSFLLESVGSAIDRAWRAAEVVRYDDTANDARLEPFARERYAAAEIGAFASVPLIRGGSIRSALSIQHNSPRRWLPREIDLLRDVAERAWVALERAEAQAALEARERNQAFLLAWNDRVALKSDADAILMETVAAIGEYLGVTHANFADTSEDGLSLSVRHEWEGGVSRIVDIAYPVAALGERLAVAHFSGQPVRIDDMELDDRFDENNRPFFRQLGFSALLTLPMIRLGKVVGCLSVQQPTARHWRDDEVELLAEVTSRTLAVLERARSEERLAASEAQLSAFMENAPVAMHLKDATGRYVRVNPQFARSLGRQRDEFQGMLPGDLFPADVAAEVERLERIARTGEVARAEISLESMAEDAWVLAMAFPVSGGTGQVRTGGFTLDLTERKKAEAALARSREMLYQTEKLSALGSLLAGVSHELNNPLSIVMAQSVMMERQAGEGPLAERAAKIRKAADRCARIVQTFLAMARQRRPERAATDLNAIVTAALELTAYGLKTEGIATALDLAPSLPLIAADADQLHQIVVNLLVNAQHAMADASERTLSVRTTVGSEPGTVALEVADTGAGVPEHVRRRIFEPFFTTKPQGQGTGVGLSFSQGLAEAHGGRLELVPTARGACFRLTLPIEAGLNPAAAPETAAQVGLPSRRALVIDDEREIAEALADFLSVEGFRCDIAEGGAAAQAELRTGRYDLIVSDLRMPGLDGPELYAWLLGERPDLARCMGFATGDTLGASAARFLAEAKRPVLEKPFMPAGVRRFLEQMDLT